MFFPGFPFGGFGQGQPSAEDGEDDDQDQQESEPTFYEIMHIGQDASLIEIEAAYKTATSIYGPNGTAPDELKLQEVNQAYETLTDTTKRLDYDQMLQSNTAQQQQNDLMSMMFGGGGKPKTNKNQQRPKMQPSKKALSVSFQNLYNGGLVDLHHERTRICQPCNGKGGQNVKKCSACKGQGATVQLVQLGPGMYTQSEKQCQVCHGMGEIFEQGLKCKICQGKKIVKNECSLKVKIQRGMPPGEVITLQGQGNEIPQAVPGDLLLIVQEQPHEQFTRKGADLYYKKSITLIQALLGFNFVLKHLNSKEYTIYTHPGQVIEDNSKKIVMGLGMPFYRGEEYGNLIVQFKVDMPKRGELSAEQIKVLSQVLPGKINVRPESSNYEMLQDFEHDNLNSNQQGGRKEDEQEDDGGQGQPCQAQ